MSSRSTELINRRSAGGEACRGMLWTDATYRSLREKGGQSDSEEQLHGDGHHSVRQTIQTHSYTFMLTGNKMRPGTFCLSGSLSDRPLFPSISPQELLHPGDAVDVDLLVMYKLCCILFSSLAAAQQSCNPSSPPRGRRGVAPSARGRPCYVSLSWEQWRRLL